MKKLVLVLRFIFFLVIRLLVGFVVFTLLVPILYYLQLHFFNGPAIPDSLSAPSPSLKLTCTRSVPLPVTPKIAEGLLYYEHLNQAQPEHQLDSTYSLYKESGLRNCIDIKFASDTSELGEVEGLSSFISNGKTYSLTILISPRYQEQDSRLIAIILSHELTHALNIKASPSTAGQCYQDEAKAFYNQIKFMELIPAKESFDLLFFPPSLEALKMLSVYFALKNSPGDTLPEKSIKFVRSTSIYSRLCNQMAN